MNRGEAGQFRAALVVSLLASACIGPSVAVGASSLAAATEDPSAGVEVFAAPDVADDGEADVAEALWCTLADADDPWPVIEALAGAADERGEVAATYRDAIAAGLGARAAEIDERREQDDLSQERRSELASLIDGLHQGEGAGLALTDGGIETLLVRITPGVLSD